jgi:hypothetical protein
MTAALALWGGCWGQNPEELTTPLAVGSYAPAHPTLNDDCPGFEAELHLEWLVPVAQGTTSGLILRHEFVAIRDPLIR